MSDEAFKEAKKRIDEAQESFIWYFRTEVSQSQNQIQGNSNLRGEQLLGATREDGGDEDKDRKVGTKTTHSHDRKGIKGYGKRGYGGSFHVDEKYAAILFKAGALGEIGEDEDTEDEATEDKAITGLQEEVVKLRNKAEIHHALESDIIETGGSCNNQVPPLVTSNYHPLSPSLSSRIPASSHQELGCGRQLSVYK
jgi:hypothetical protein